MSESLLLNAEAWLSVKEHRMAHAKWQSSARAAEADPPPPAGSVVSATGRRSPDEREPEREPYMAVQAEAALVRLGSSLEDAWWESFQKRKAVAEAQRAKQEAEEVAS